MNTITLDAEQINAHIAHYDRCIAESETRLNVLRSECEQYRGQRKAWAYLKEELERNDIT